MQLGNGAPSLSHARRSPPAPRQVDSRTLASPYVMRHALVGSVGDVLYKRLDWACEVGAELVYDFRMDIRSMVVREFRKRHPIEARGLGDLLDRDAPALPKFEIGDSFL